MKLVKLILKLTGYTMLFLLAGIGIKTVVKDYVIGYLYSDVKIEKSKEINADTKVIKTTTKKVVPKVVKKTNSEKLIGFEHHIKYKAKHVDNPTTWIEEGDIEIREEGLLMNQKYMWLRYWQVTLAASTQIATFFGKTHRDFRFFIKDKYGVEHTCMWVDMALLLPANKGKKGVLHKPGKTTMYRLGIEDKLFQTAVSFHLEVAGKVVKSVMFSDNK